MSEIILDHEYREKLREIAKEQFDTRTLSGEINDSNKAFAVICIGAELGLSPIQSLRGIHVIKGKPVLSAQLIQAIVVRRRDVCEFFMLAESTREKATYRCKRVGDPEPTTLTYTIEDAKFAGLLNNPTWKSHPAAMLRNRCVAALARAVFPDLAMGLYEDSEGEEIRGSDDYARRLPAVEPTPIDASRVPPQLPAADQEPAGAFAPTEAERVEKYRAALASCDTQVDLYELAKELKSLPERVKEQLKPIYVARKEQLALAEAAANGVAS